MNTHRPHTPTEEEKKAINTAMKVVRNIDTLIGSEEFQWFMQQHSDRADQLAQNVLHGEMPPDKREALRNRRLGVLDVLLSLKEDRDAQIGLLARYGMSPGDPVE